MVIDAVRVQAHHQVKVPLVRVRFPFFPHVVARGLAEMQSAHRHLGYLFFAQVQSIKISTQTLATVLQLYWSTTSEI